MFDRLVGVEKRFVELETKLSDPEVISDQNRYRSYGREHSELAEIVSVFRQYVTNNEELEASRALLKDADTEMRSLARDEIKSLSEIEEKFTLRLKKLLLPKDPNDAKNVIIEIRAGTGGEEAALFAADLFGMYTRYAERKKWQSEILAHHLTGVGGMKEVIAMISGKGAYSRFKYESGTHRVQRVPVTEAQGRIHTSAVTVAVLPEAKDVEVHIDTKDIKVDVFRSTGPGGQSVNTTDSAVRITHLPTGMVVTCQDEKSQHKNKARAMKVLQARLLDQMITEENEKRAQQRKTQVGTGDRSQRIRTYNFPQGRVTDHRIGMTLYRLDTILAGDIDEIIDGLITFYQAQSLQEVK